MLKNHNKSLILSLQLKFTIFFDFLNIEFLDTILDFLTVWRVDSAEQCSAYASIQKSKQTDLSAVKNGKNLTFWFLILSIRDIELAFSRQIEVVESQIRHNRFIFTTFFKERIFTIFLFKLKVFFQDFFQQNRISAGFISRQIKVVQSKIALNRFFI